MTWAELKGKTIACVAVASEGEVRLTFYDGVRAYLVPRGDERGVDIDLRDKPGTGILTAPHGGQYGDGSGASDAEFVEQ